MFYRSQTLCQLQVVILKPRWFLVIHLTMCKPLLVDSTSVMQTACSGSHLRYVHITVAVSEKQGDLSSFLNWYIGTRQQPNITTLAVHGLPAGRGRKGGVPKRQRSKVNPRVDVTVLRPATCRGSLNGDKVNIDSTLSVHQASTSIMAHYQPPLTTSTLPCCNTQTASHLTSIAPSTPVLTQNQTINIHPSIICWTISLVSIAICHYEPILLAVYTGKHKNLSRLTEFVAYFGW